MFHWSCSWPCRRCLSGRGGLFLSSKMWLTLFPDPRHVLCSFSLFSPIPIKDIFCSRVFFWWLVVLICFQSFYFLWSFFSSYWSFDYIGNHSLNHGYMWKVPILICCSYLIVDYIFKTLMDIRVSKLWHFSILVYLLCLIFAR